MIRLLSACILGMTILTYTTLAQSVAFEIQEPTLIPEGITIDSTTGKFYLTSIAKNKIIEISGNQSTDFIQPGQYGFVGGLGIHVDGNHHVLWSCSGDFNGHTYTTGIFGFDLRTNKLVYRFFLPTDTSKNFFNDLAIADNGDLFITNSDGNSIWQWKYKAPRPEKTKLPAVAEPNGIVWDKDRSLLFVATRKGLVALSPATKTLHTLAMPDGETSTGLDGLVFYKNSIIAVRNGFRDKTKHGIMRFYLSSDGLSIIKTRAIDLHNPMFDIPTTLAIRGNQLFVVCNSQMDLLDEQKNIGHQRAPKNPIILSYTLSD
ncbi:MAG: hypothetical protein U0289_08870 [Cyclobacteriaceae bacterium]|nr:hypothetical protein [Cytophagales bacterium]HNP77858.1 hypothetical protein [Cyclobacteriaceae bacterium]HQQ81985.1 hypothetical protein [Cyclobacteriaceae bacterium]